mmetsp:Transcript_107435/g.312387  ORF Transcript_107435/g.312387 Transcript_107435/m.312387 type:complete len:211 (+) Transcript_107435:109-741(+)
MRTVRAPLVVGASVLPANGPSAPVARTDCAAARGAARRARRHAAALVRGHALRVETKTAARLATEPFGARMANGVVANGGYQVGLVLQACADCLLVGQNLRTVFQSVAGHAGNIDVVFGLDSLAGFIGAALQSAGLSPKFIRCVCQLCRQLADSGGLLTLENLVPCLLVRHIDARARLGLRYATLFIVLVLAGFCLGSHCLQRCAGRLRA